MSKGLPKLGIEDFRRAAVADAAHSEGVAEGEAFVRELVAAQIEGLEERMVAELIDNGWPATDARAAAHLVLPVIRDTVGTV